MKLPTHLKTELFAKGQIPDGFFGNTQNVEFHFLPENGKTIAVHKHGFFTYHTPPALNVKEALWLLRNHPTSNAKFIQEV